MVSESNGSIRLDTWRLSTMTMINLRSSWRRQNKAEVHCNLKFTSLIKLYRYTKVTQEAQQHQQHTTTTTRSVATSTTYNNNNSTSSLRVHLTSSLGVHLALLSTRIQVCLIRSSSGTHLLKTSNLSSIQKKKPKPQSSSSATESVRISSAADLTHSSSAHSVNRDHLHQRV